MKLWIIIFTSFLLQIQARGEENLPVKNACLQSIIDEKEKQDIYAPNKKVVFAFIFYKVNSDKFVAIQEVPGYSRKKIKGYCELKDCLLTYYGINDTLATRFINWQFTHDTNVLNNYMNFDDMDGNWDKPNDVYRIRNDSLALYEPSKKHIEALSDLLIEHGIRQQPPPVPNL